jgi:hypothetical protein
VGGQGQGARRGALCQELTGRQAHRGLDASAALAVRIHVSRSGKVIELVNYGRQPIQLNEVQRNVERSSLRLP